MSLAVLADHMASKGRGPDSMLIHMSPREVQGLQALAMKHGGSLTINPETGLPEAGFLDKLLPAIIGFAVTAATGLPAWQVGLGVGAVQTARTGDLGKGISAGLGAYGGAGIGAGMSAAGASSIGGQGAGIAGDMTFNLADAGSSFSNALPGGETGILNSSALSDEAVKGIQQQTADRVAAASPFDKISRGFDAVKANPMGYANADNFKYMAAAAAPILADQAVKSNLPQTTTRSGQIRPSFYDPYSGTYTAGNPYEAQVKKAADGGVMGFDESANSPMSRRSLDGMENTGGMFNYAHDGGGVMKMAEGGIAGYAPGGEIFDWFKTNQGKSDADIAAQMQAKDWTPEMVANATGTQNQLADYQTRFAKAVATPTTDASEFLAATKDVGLQNQPLANALQSSGMSPAAQYALTHELNDTGGIKGTDFYTDIGYTPGAQPGDKGGLEGLYSNINYAAQGLQNQIASGDMTGQEARRAAIAEMNRIGLSAGDLKAATGKTLAELFPDTKTVVTPPVASSVVLPDPFKSVVPGAVQLPNATTYDNGAFGNYGSGDKTGVDYKGNTVSVATPGDIITNPDDTRTAVPNIPGRPYGGFPGMEAVKSAYTAGGGNLGYTPYAPKTIEDFNTKYNKLTGGSKQSYDYLTGKTPYSPTPYTPTGQVMKPYAESVLGMPANVSKKMYLFDPVTKQYKINPDYAIPTYDKDGKKTYNVTNKDVIAQMATKPSASDFYTWAKANNLSVEQIAAATGMPITEIQKLFSGGAPADTSTATGNASSESSSGTGGQAGGGLAALTMARGGTTHMPFFSKSTGKFTSRAPQVYADGGSAQFNLGGYSDGGRLLKGPGDGVSDSIPATIGNKQPARLADGEFVVPARIVSELGNGSTEAGARKLYAMMDRVQAARKGSIGKGKVANNSRADKYLPA